MADFVPLYGAAEERYDFCLFDHEEIEELNELPWSQACALHLKCLFVLRAFPLFVLNQWFENSLIRSKYADRIPQNAIPALFKFAGHIRGGRRFMEYCHIPRGNSCQNLKLLV